MATNVTSFIETKVTNKDQNLFRKGGVKTFATSKKLSSKPRDHFFLSQPTPNGHLVMVPAVSQSFYCKQTLCLAGTSIRQRMDTLKSSTDTSEVLNVTANYDLEKKNS